MTEHRKDKLKPERCIVLMLRFFTDVLYENLKDKTFTYTVKPKVAVPEHSLQLWKKRGYDPAALGIAVVTFEGDVREFTYPAYLWSV